MRCEDQVLGARLDWGWDWADWLGTDDTLSAATWSVEAADPEDDADLPSVGDDTFSATETVIWVDTPAGTCARAYLTVAIESAQGRTERRSILLRTVTRH